MPTLDEIRKGSNLTSAVETDSTFNSDLGASQEDFKNMIGIPDESLEIKQEKDTTMIEGLGEFLWYGAGGAVESASAGASKLLFGRVKGEEIDTFAGKVGYGIGGALGFLVPFSKGKKALDFAAKKLAAKGSTVDDLAMATRGAFKKRVKAKDIIVEGTMSTADAAEKLKRAEHVLETKFISKITNWRTAFATASAKNAFSNTMTKEFGDELLKVAAKQNVKLNPRAMNKLTKEVGEIFTEKALNGNPISGFQELLAKKMGDGWLGTAGSHLIEEAAIFAAIENFAFAMGAANDEYEYTPEGVMDTTKHALTLGAVLGGIRLAVPGGLKGGSVDFTSRDGWRNIGALLLNRKPIAKKLDLNIQANRESVANTYKQYSRMEVGVERGGPIGLEMRRFANNNYKKYGKELNDHIGNVYNEGNLLKAMRSGDEVVSKQATKLMADSVEDIFNSVNSVWKPQFKKMIKEDWIGGGAGSIGSLPRMLAGGLAMTGGDVLLDENLPIEEKALHFFIGAFLMKSGKELTYKTHGGPGGYATKWRLGEFDSGTTLQINQLTDLHKTFGVEYPHPLFQSLQEHHKQAKAPNWDANAGGEGFADSFKFELNHLQKKGNTESSENDFLFYKGTFPEDKSAISNYNKQSKKKGKKLSIAKRMKNKKEVSEMPQNYKQLYEVLTNYIGGTKSVRDKLIEDNNLSDSVESITIRDWESLSDVAKLEHKKYIDKNRLIFPGELLKRITEGTEPQYNKTKADAFNDIAVAASEIMTTVEGNLIPLGAPGIKKNKISNANDYQFLTFYVDKIPQSEGRNVAEVEAVLQYNAWVEGLVGISNHRINKKVTLESNVDLTNFVKSMDIMESGFRKNWNDAFGTMPEKTIDATNHKFWEMMQLRERMSQELDIVKNLPHSFKNQTEGIGEKLNSIFRDNDTQVIRDKVQLPSKGDKRHKYQDFADDLSKILPVLGESKNSLTSSDGTVYNLKKAEVQTLKEVYELFNERGWQHFTGKLPKTSQFFGRAHQQDFIAHTLRQHTIANRFLDAKDSNGNDLTMKHLLQLEIYKDNFLVDENLNTNKFVVSDLNMLGQELSNFNKRFPERGLTEITMEMVDNVVKNQNISELEATNMRKYVELKQSNPFFKKLPNPQQIQEYMEPLLVTDKNPRGLLSTDRSYQASLSDSQMINLMNNIKNYHEHNMNIDRNNSFLNSLNQNLVSENKGLRKAGKALDRLLFETNDLNQFVENLAMLKMIDVETGELKINSNLQRLSSEEMLSKTRQEFKELMQATERDWELGEREIRINEQRTKELALGEQQSNNKSLTLTDILAQNKVSTKEFEFIESDVQTHSMQIKQAYYNRKIDNGERKKTKQVDETVLLSNFVTDLRKDIISSNKEKYANNNSRNQLTTELLGVTNRLQNSRIKKIVFFDGGKPSKTTSDFQPYQENNVSLATKKALGSEDVPFLSELGKSDLIYFSDTYVNNQGKQVNAFTSNSINSLLEAAWIGNYGKKLTSKQKGLQEELSAEPVLKTSGTLVDLGEGNLLFVPKSDFPKIAKNYVTYINKMAKDRYISKERKSALLEKVGITINTKGKAEFAPVGHQEAFETIRPIMTDLVYGEVVGHEVWWTNKYGDAIRENQNGETFNFNVRIKGFGNENQNSISIDNLNTMKNIINNDKTYPDRKKYKKDIDDLIKEEYAVVNDEIIGKDGKKTGDIAKPFSRKDIVNERDYLPKLKAIQKEFSNDVGVYEKNENYIRLKAAQKLLLEGEDSSIYDGHTIYPNKYLNIFKLLYGETEFNNVTVKGSITSRFGNGAATYQKTQLGTISFGDVAHPTTFTSSTKHFGKTYPVHGDGLKVLDIKNITELQNSNTFKGKLHPLFYDNTSPTINLLSLKRVKEGKAPSNATYFLDTPAEKSFIENYTNNSSGPIKEYVSKLSGIKQLNNFANSRILMTKLISKKEVELASGESTNETMSTFSRMIGHGVHFTYMNKQAQQMIYSEYGESMFSPKLTGSSDSVLIPDAGIGNKRLRSQISDKEGLIQFAEHRGEYAQGQVRIKEKDWKNISFVKRNLKGVEELVYWNDTARAKDPILSQLDFKKIKTPEKLVDKLVELQSSKPGGKVIGFKTAKQSTYVYDAKQRQTTRTKIVDNAGLQPKSTRTFYMSETEMARMYINGIANSDARTAEKVSDKKVRFGDVEYDVQFTPEIGLQPFEVFVDIKDNTYFQHRGNKIIELKYDTEVIPRIEHKYQLNGAMFRNPMASPKSWIPFGVRRYKSKEQANTQELGSDTVARQLDGDFDIDTGISSVFLPKDMMQSIVKNQGKVGDAADLLIKSHNPTSTDVNFQDANSMVEFRRKAIIGKKILGTSMKTNAHIKDFLHYKSSGFTMLKSDGKLQEGFILKTQDLGKKGMNRFVTLRSEKEINQSLQDLYNSTQHLVDTGKNPFDFDRFNNSRILQMDLLFGNKLYGTKGIFQVMSHNERIMEKVPGAELTQFEKEAIMRLVDIKNKVLTVKDKVYQDNGSSRSSNVTDIARAAERYFLDLSGYNDFRLSNGKKIRDQFNIGDFHHNKNPFTMNKKSFKLQGITKNTQFTNTDLALETIYKESRKGMNKPDGKVYAQEPFGDINLQITKDNNITDAMKLYVQRVKTIGEKETFMNNQINKRNGLYELKKYHEPGSDEMNSLKNEIKLLNESVEYAETDWFKTQKETIINDIKDGSIKGKVSDLMIKATREGKEIDMKDINQKAEKWWKDTKEILRIKAHDPDLMTINYAKQLAYRTIGNASARELGMMPEVKLQTDATVDNIRKNYIKDLSRTREGESEIYDNAFEVNNEYVDILYEAIKPITGDTRQHMHYALMRLLTSKIDRTAIVEYKGQYYPHIKSRDANSFQDFFSRFISKYNNSVEGDFLEKQIADLYNKYYFETNGLENSYQDARYADIRPVENMNLGALNPLDFYGKNHTNRLLYEELGKDTSVLAYDAFDKMDSYAKLHSAYGFGTIRNIMNNESKIDVPTFAITEMSRYGRHMSEDGLVGVIKAIDMNSAFSLNRVDKGNPVNHFIGTEINAPVGKSKSKDYKHPDAEDKINEIFEKSCLSK